MTDDPTTEHPAEVTRLLLDWSQGNQEALASLMPLVCNELRGMARGYLHNENNGHTLQPTALVNEVYLRLHNCKTVNWKNRAHFFGFAAKLMRRVLVDHVRGRHTSKRGDGVKPVPLDQALDKIGQSGFNLDLVALDQALHTLKEMDDRQASIVDMRFFIGLTVEETAEILQVSAPTVKREWRMAKLWLYREIGGPKSAPPPLSRKKPKKEKLEEPKKEKPTTK